MKLSVCTYFACLLALALLPHSAQAGSYTITGLGFLGTGPTGTGYSVAAAINDSGQICGTSDVYDNAHKQWVQRAFLYTDNAMTDLGGLGTGPNGELSYSKASALNNSGQVTGTASFYNAQHQLRGLRAFLYSNDSMTDLGTPTTDAYGNGYSEGKAINDSGQVAGDYTPYTLYDGDIYDNGYAPFTFRNGAFIQLGQFGADNDGRGYAYALAVTADGNVVAGGTYNVNHGGDDGNSYGGQIVGVFALPYPQYSPTVTLGNFGYDDRHTYYARRYTVALGANASGMVVGYSVAYNSDYHYRGPQAFLYDPKDGLDAYGHAAIRNLGGFGQSQASSVYSRARAISNNGLVVGDSTVYDAAHIAHGTAAFLYKDGQMQMLGDFGISKEGHVYSTAIAVNDQGDILGFAKFFTPQHRSPRIHPFLYRKGKLHDLYQLVGFPAGWSDLQPVAINNAGQIIGSGLHNGNTEAFVIAPPSN